MRIINGGRQVGKTYKIIKHAHETGNIILVSTTKRANIIKLQADMMGYKDVRVYSVEELNRPELLRGTELGHDLIQGKVKIDIDDMEDVIKCYVPFKIDMASCNIPETPNVFDINIDDKQFLTQVLGIPYTSDK